MKLIDLTCPKCNATLQVNTNLKRCICEYCGNEFIIDEEAIRIENGYNFGYELEMGRMKAIEDIRRAHKEQEERIRKQKEQQRHIKQQQEIKRRQMIIEENKKEAYHNEVIKWIIICLPVGLIKMYWDEKVGDKLKLVIYGIMSLITTITILYTVVYGIVRWISIEGVVVNEIAPVMIFILLCIIMETLLYTAITKLMHKIKHTKDKRIKTKEKKEYD